MSASKIIEIFEDILDIEKGKVNLNSTPEDIEEWDSVATINIIVAIEDEFKIKFKLKDVQEATSVKDFLELVEVKKK
jgi:acyl carrier protein